MGYMYALSWKLLIIGLLSEYFATLLKRLHLKKIATKHSIFFLMVRSRMFFGDKDQISSGEGKRKGKSQFWVERVKMRCFCKIPLLSQIQALSHKLLVTQTSNYHHCTLHTQKPTCMDFQVTSSSSSWSKTTFCIFKELICLPKRKCYGKK